MLVSLIVPWIRGPREIKERTGRGGGASGRTQIEKLHKRALQIIHFDYDSALNYEDLLLRDNSVTIHQRNMQFLMTEIFKTIHGLSSSFMPFPPGGGTPILGHTRDVRPEWVIFQA